jgi:hypothetical protein
MSTEEEGRPGLAELEQAIRLAIVQRTGGRIQTLEVEVVADRVVISGQVPSYYLKQLVLQGVLDVVGPAAASGVECNVQVMASASRPVEGAD